MTVKNNPTLETIRLLIVDDHQMVRDGIKVMLSQLKKAFHFQIAEAEGVEEALRKVESNPFDIILMDYQMPGLHGAEAVVRILRYRPQTRIIALSNYDELSYIQSMIEAGAKGYILKNIDPAQLLAAIKTVRNDQPYYSNEVALKLIEGVKKEKVKKEVDQYGLTKRELEVLQLIARELTNDEIAQQLFVSKRTIDTHRQNLLNKLQAKNTVGLLNTAYRLDLIKVQ